MTDKLKPSVKEKRGRVWLKRLWGVLPIVGLLATMMILSGFIKSKSDMVEARKKGILALEGMKAAADHIDRVVDILRSSEDVHEAAKKLTSELKMTPDQVDSIVHMPLGALVKSEQDKLGGQIAKIKKHIADGTLEAETETPDVNVVALEVTPRLIRDRINLPGVVLPWVKYNILAEVRGEVRKKQIEKGATVKAKEIIAVLDTRDYEIALQAAKASYDTALASMRRLEKLYKEQLASRSQIDDITAQVERCKAEMDSAALNLERCTIRSPISGIINNLYFETGQYINISDPVAEVLQMDRVKVKVGIPESDVSRVRDVDTFQVKFDALGGRVFTAAKYFLSSASSPQARLYDLELSIDNPTGEILPDMFARVDIVKQERRDILSVPLYSIITLNDERIVYVVNDSVAHARKVKTGMQEGWRIEITEGLHAGEHVIVMGHRSVSDGQKVNVIREVLRMEDLTR